MKYILIILGSLLFFTNIYASGISLADYTLIKKCQSLGPAKKGFVETRGLVGKIIYVDVYASKKNDECSYGCFEEGAFLAIVKSSEIKNTKDKSEVILPPVTIATYANVKRDNYDLVHNDFVLESGYEYDEVDRIKFVINKKLNHIAAHCYN